MITQKTKAPEIMGVFPAVLVLAERLNAVSTSSTSRALDSGENLLSLALGALLSCAIILRHLLCQRREVYYAAAFSERRPTKRLQSVARKEVRPIREHVRISPCSKKKDG